MSICTTLCASLAIMVSQIGWPPILPDDPSMKLARTLLAQNLELEGFKPTDLRFRRRLLDRFLLVRRGRSEGSFAGTTHIGTVGKVPTVIHFSYAQERRAEELKVLRQLTSHECRALMQAYRVQLGFPSDLQAAGEKVEENSVTYTFRRPPVEGHRSIREFSLKIGRFGGVLLSAQGDLPYTAESLPSPKLTADEATLISLNELRTVGGFSITMFREPILMFGKPSTHDTYRDRVAINRVNEFDADQPMTFWRVDLFESDGTNNLGMQQIIEVDTQTGEVIGQRRLFGRTEPLPAPALSWKRIGKVSVIGDLTKTEGLVEFLATKEIPQGKPVAVRSGMLVYACRYDATRNILWRRLPYGEYEAGRPDTKLAKILKSKAR